MIAYDNVFLPIKDVQGARVFSVRFLSEPFAIATGTAVEFEDPDGNRLCFTEYTKTNVEGLI
ncbi:MAG: hypothetical protein ABF449_05210 [Ethanoligenens sp.]|uniref:hypothetical protein n=1 Tax=Ethanoligenens sp. TaxID=2099655 RepID=UPI0039ED680A